MKKSFLNQNFDAVYSIFLLFNKDDQTMIAGTQRMPMPGSPAFAYIPVLKDFEKIESSQVLAIISIKQYKT